MTLQVGVIGLGVMGAEHLRLLREETAGAAVVAICDADAARARTLAAGADVFDDPFALIASDRVEAVVIASPDATHAGLALACLAAGKPALCEKPLALTAGEALQIVNAEAGVGRRLLQVGYMRRFDPAYCDMKRSTEDGLIGPDISRWLLGSEPVSAMVHAAPGRDPLLITLETDRGEVISTEVFMNACYGYHVHAQIVGRSGTVEMAQPAVMLTNSAMQHGHRYSENWVPRFRDAYRRQMGAWVRSVSTGVPVGASAWDGYVATTIAEQIVAALGGCGKVSLTLAPRPDFYR